MSRGIPAQVLAQMDATQKRPVYLFELGLSSTLRFAAYNTNITFPTAGNVYTAKNITVSGVSQSLNGQIGRITVKFDNVSRDMAAYANNESFKGKSLTIKRIYLDAVGDPSYYNEVFNGFMESPKDFSRHWVTVTATTGKPLFNKVLVFPYQRLCPWVFGGAECNTDSNADLAALTASGTADSGSTTTLVHSGLTQADDYWNNGRITVIKGGTQYRRKIKDFVASTDTLTFDVELPVSVDNTTTYVLYKGCDKTWDSCQSSNAWGPSADNKLNYGGCIHITSPKDAE